MYATREYADICSESNVSTRTWKLKDWSLFAPLEYDGCVAFDVKFVEQFYRRLSHQCFCRVWPATAILASPGAYLIGANVHVRLFRDGRRQSRILLRGFHLRRPSERIKSASPAAVCVVCRRNDVPLIQRDLD